MDELLRKYIEGRCSEDEFNIAVKMLMSEPVATETIQSMRQHWYALKSEASTAGEPAGFKSVLERIHYDVNVMEAGDDRRRYLKTKKVNILLRIAAVFIFCIFSLFSLWQARENSILRQESIYTVASVRGQSSKVNMPDGSEIWLNGESSVTYSSSFGIRNRKLSLEGEGFFSVSKNADIPFVVEAGATHITALGTTFNVDAGRGGDNVTVTMEKGRVLIEKSDMRTEISCGQQACVSDKGIDVTSVDFELYTSWRNGQIVFKDETLLTITSQLEKMYDVKFIYKSDTLKSYRYRGTIRLDNSIFKALEMLKLSTGIIYEVKGNEVILKK